MHTYDIHSFRYLILVATSGDTGGAVLDGFSKYAGISRNMMLEVNDLI